MLWNVGFVKYDHGLCAYNSYVVGEAIGSDATPVVNVQTTEFGVQTARPYAPELVEMSHLSIVRDLCNLTN